MVVTIRGRIESLAVDAYSVQRRTDVDLDRIVRSESSVCAVDLRSAVEKRSGVLTVRIPSGEWLELLGRVHDSSLRAMQTRDEVESAWLDDPARFDVDQQAELGGIERRWKEQQLAEVFRTLGFRHPTLQARVYDSRNGRRIHRNELPGGY